MGNLSTKIETFKWFKDQQIDKDPFGSSKGAEKQVKEVVKGRGGTYISSTDIFFSAFEFGFCFQRESKKINISQSFVQSGDFEVVATNCIWYSTKFPKVIYRVLDHSSYCLIVLD